MKKKYTFIKPAGLSKVLIPVLVVCLMTWAVSLPAKPYVAISGVDSESEFPFITIMLSVNNGVFQKSGELNEEHLYLLEDGYRVNYFSIKEQNGEREAGYYVLCMDSSRSLKSGDLKRLSKSAADLVSAASSNDMFALYRFNDEVKLLNTFTKNKSEIERKLNRIDLHGHRTQLLNAVYDSLELLGRIEGRKKAVIVYTDGIDEGSSIETADIIAIARERRIPVFFTAPREKAKIHSLARIARLTGGKVFSGTSTRNGKMLLNYVRDSFPGLYTIRYKSMLQADGKPHVLEVRIKYNSIQDRDAREISLKRRLLDVSFPSIYQFLIILMVLLVFAMLLFILIYIFRRRSFFLRKTPLAYDKKLFGESVISSFGRTISEDTIQRIHRDRVITSADPEYVYSKAWLLQKDGPEMGKKFPVFWEEVSLGRDEENTVVIKDEAVSLKHAKIKEMKGAYYLFDLASDNGTFLNGKKLLRPKPLYDWDEISIGRTLFIFRGSKIT